MRPTYTNTLVLIPARAGSKGVPKKNSKPFANGPSLVERCIDLSKKVFSFSHIVLSTDDEDLLDRVKSSGIQLLKREEHLASDSAGMLDVMLDAINKQNWDPSYLLLLQPTSPFRNLQHIEQAFQLFAEDDQAVVAVNEPKGHPYYTLFQEENGFIEKFQKNNVVRRQDLKPMYDVNGLLYLFDVHELKKRSWVEFERIRPLIIPAWQAIDIDTQEDWWFAETLFKSIQSADSIE